MTKPTTLRASGEMNQWVVDINAEICKHSNAKSQEEQCRKKRSIYRLPSLISETKKGPYQPQAVSFGPNHHGELHLMPMEEHKHRALLNFVHRSPLPLGVIFNSMVEVVQELKDSYSSLDSEWQDTEKFVKLMIIDGCFMLEILRAAAQKSETDRETQERGCDYSRDDPIFGSHGELYAMPFIRRDMLLLENQLPILVLFKLKDIKENDQRDMEALNELILKFYGNYDHGKHGKCLHILDLYRKSLLVNKKPKNTNSTPQQLCSASSAKHKDSPGPDRATVVRSATELDEAGIRFKTSGSKSLTDISFDKGVLSLPKFFVDDDTESTFLNLIAFERCHIGAGHDVTSFICFMDKIVDHDHDIRLLSSKGIIHNVAGTDKAAADLFNTMSKDLTMDSSSHLNMVHANILSYCTNPWPKWRAMLLHNYFKSPWSIISVVAAIILFGLATVSTVYDVK